MNKKDLEQIREIVEEVLASKSKCTVIEPEFEADKWYWYKQNGKLNLVFTKSDGHCYGFDWDGSWIEEPFWSHASSNDWLEGKATKEEIEEALIKEAKRRGFKEGTIFHSIMDNSEHIIVSNQFTMTNSYGLCVTSEQYKSDKGIYIFENGKWAKIIDNKLEINGHDVSLNKGMIKIGCSPSVDFNDFRTFVKLLEFYNVQVLSTHESKYKAEDLRNILNKL